MVIRRNFPVLIVLLSLSVVMTIIVTQDYAKITANYKAVIVNGKDISNGRAAIEAALAQEGEHESNDRAVVEAAQEGEQKSNDRAVVEATLESESDSLSCPVNHFLFENKILPEEITHRDRLIPRVIHLFAHSKCLPNEMAQYMEKWTSLPEHSVIIHDQEEMIDYLEQERKDVFPYIPKASKCAVTHEALLDLSRFMVLYDQGGISVDIDYIPGPGFQNGTLLDDTVEGTQWEFLILEEEGKEKESSTSPYFLASMPKHPAMNFPILHSVAGQYRQFINETTSFSYHTDDSRKAIYNSVSSKYLGRDYNHKITKFTDAWTGKGSSVIGKIVSTRIDGKIFKKIQMRTDDHNMESSLHFHDFDKDHACVDLTNDSYEVDVESLLELVGDVNENDKGSCPMNQIYMNNVYLPDTIQIEGRKIPNIVHMTSKIKCFTQIYADNVEAWKFEGHSFFLHDDTAVDRLLSRNWPEFPLVGHAKSCLFAGAQLADYWRYVALWAYGGIYTDIDNGVGPMLLDGDQTIISDEVDAFFEVESGRFPSQYFFAVSPHHPVSYFMVSSAIERLITSGKTFIPWVTGPGAVKAAVINSIGGDGYPEGNKTYNGVYGRSITMVGSRQTAKSHSYIDRSSIAPGDNIDDLKAMDMPHYLSMGQFDLDEQKEKERAKKKEKSARCAATIFEESIL